MHNITTTTLHFDRKNYTQAALYTAIIAAVLLLLVWFVKFYQPIPPTPPPVAEEIEINLGSSDVGSGNDQPELPGEPAPAEQASYSPPQPAEQVSNESVKDIEENNEPDAPPVLKPSVTKPDAKRLNEETKVAKTTTAPTPTPAPPAPKPRAVMGQVRGGNGNGGNGAATYKPGTGEGQGGGAGDQGSIGGNPNGRDYTPRRLGVRVVSIPAQSFEDDFSEGGTIALDIEVDPNGRLVSASYQVNGSSLQRSSKQYNIALTRARQIKYPQYEGGFKQKLSFNFSVK